MMEVIWQPKATKQLKMGIEPYRAGQNPDGYAGAGGFPDMFQRQTVDQSRVYAPVARR